MVTSQALGTVKLDTYIFAQNTIVRMDIVTQMLNSKKLYSLSNLRRVDISLYWAPRTYIVRRRYIYFEKM